MEGGRGVTFYYLWQAGAFNVGRHCIKQFPPVQAAFSSLESTHLGSSPGTPFVRLSSQQPEPRWFSPFGYHWTGSSLSLVRQRAITRLTAGYHWTGSGLSLVRQRAITRLTAGYHWPGSGLSLVRRRRCVDIPGS